MTLSKKIINKLKCNLDKISLPGFKGISILNLFQFLKEIFQNGNFSIRSAAVSFRFFVAIFPTLIFLLSLIPYLPIEGLKDQILGNDTLMPNIIYELFQNTINELFNNKHNALLSIGFILSLYYASLGINTLFTAFSQSYQIKLKNNYFKQQLLSLGIFLLMMFLFLSATIISIISDKIHGLMVIEEISILLNYLFGIFHFVLELSVIMLAISILYHFGNPETKKFKLISPGSLFSTIVIFLATWGLSIYFSNFNIYNKIYGSIGSLLITLIWLNTVSYVLMIGFELYTKADKIKKHYIN